MDISNIWIGSSGFSLKHVLRIAAVALVLLSLPVAYLAWARERDLTTMRTQGVDTVATVIKGLDDVRRGSGRRSHTHHFYYLTLSWSDSDGHERIFTRQVYSNLFFHVAKTSPDARWISIRYLPGRPDVQPLIPTEPTDTSNDYLFIAAALFALGLGSAWLGWPPRRAMEVAAA